MTVAIVGQAMVTAGLVALGLSFIYLIFAFLSGATRAEAQWLLRSGVLAVLSIAMLTAAQALL